VVEKGGMRREWNKLENLLRSRINCQLEGKSQQEEKMIRDYSVSLFP